jgi:hypothetical protein
MATGLAGGFAEYRPGVSQHVASPEFHPVVEQAKDVSAGAVLICTGGAILVGLVVFLPRLILFLR